MMPLFQLSCCLVAARIACMLRVCLCCNYLLPTELITTQPAICTQHPTRASVHATPPCTQCQHRHWYMQLQHCLSTQSQHWQLVHAKAQPTHVHTHQHCDGQGYNTCTLRDLRRCLSLSLSLSSRSLTSASEPESTDAERLRRRLSRCLRVSDVTAARDAVLRTDGVTAGFVCSCADSQSLTFVTVFRLASAVSFSTPAASVLCRWRNAATSGSVGLIGPPSTNSAGVSTVTGNS